MNRTFSELIRSPTLEVARDLLGWTLIHDSPEGTVSGTIVECEAYLADDPASHSYRGPTRRNAPMYGAPGRAYIYFIYGMHYCFNVVTGDPGIGEAVLIRAVEPIEGLPLMMARRGTREARDLINGPAKLVQAFGIEINQNGASLESGTLRIERGIIFRSEQIATTPRIGLSAGQDLPYRFAVRGSKFLSKPISRLAK